MSGTAGRCRLGPWRWTPLLGRCTCGDWDNYVVIAFDQQGGQKALYNVSLTSHALQTGEQYVWVPLAVAVAADGSLWVANLLDDWVSVPGFSAEISFNSFVTHFAANGSVLQQFNTSDASRWDGASFSGITEPNDMALDDAGNVWLADTWNGRVLQYSPSGKQLASYNLGALPLVEPIGVAVDSSGNMLITQGGLQPVVKLSPAGQVLGKFSVPTSNFWPGGIVVDSDSFIYLSDENNRQALKLSPQGAVVQVFNTTRPPLSDWVRGLALDAAKNVYVVGRGAAALRQVRAQRHPPVLVHRVHAAAVRCGGRSGRDGVRRGRDEGEGRRLRQQRLPCSPPSPPATPRSATPPASSFSQAQATSSCPMKCNARVVILSPAGALLAVIAPPGPPMCPEHMTFNAKGDLYLADACGDRILIFQLSTSPPHWIVSATSPSSTSSSGVSGGALAGLIVGCVLGGALLSCVFLAALWCACRGNGEGKRTGPLRVGGGGALQFKRQSDDEEMDSSHAESQAVEMS